jgi:hypothetical protein
MSTSATPTPGEKLLAQLEADLALFTELMNGSLFAIIANVLTKLPQIISDIKATIADFKAAV